MLMPPRPQPLGDRLHPRAKRRADSDAPGQPEQPRSAWEEAVRIIERLRYQARIEPGPALP
jgi:hypothetical protein